MVINVLDEMINVAYDKDEIADTKMPATCWVDTDNADLVLLSPTLEGESMMEVDK